MAVSEKNKQQEPSNADPEAPPPDDGKDQNQTEGNDGGNEVVEEVFDKDRALETIRKQRENERQLTKALKEAQARLKAFDDAEKARQDAEKSELQKAQERAADLEKALQESRETTQALLLKQSFLSTARKMNLKFASPTAEEDAFELADLEGVEIDENGKVTGLENAVEALQSSRPYLFAQASPEDSGDKQGTPKRGKPGNGKLNPEAVKTGYRIRF